MNSLSKFIAACLVCAILFIPNSFAAEYGANLASTDSAISDKRTEQEHDHASDHSDHENGADHGEAGEGSHDQHGEEEALEFSSSRLHDFGVIVSTAGEGTIRQVVSLPGEVKLNAEAVAHITPRFPAKIIKVRAKTGDRVKAGDELALAESSETLSQFSLKSLIDGIVIKRHVTLGEHLTPEDTAFVIADMSTLWVDIALYPAQIPLVAVGQPAQVTTIHGPAPVQTVIGYVAPVVDEQTRTGSARIFLSDPKGEWKPGMFIRGDIVVGEFAADVVVPKTAVISLDGGRSVFVQHDENWEPQVVDMGREDDTHVEILSGLNAGDRYVAKGGFVLKAQLEKGELESGHNH